MSGIETENLAGEIDMMKTDGRAMTEVGNTIVRTASENGAGVGTGRTRRRGSAAKAGREARKRTRKTGMSDVRSQEQFLANTHSSLRDRDRSLSPHSKAKAEKKAAKAAMKREEELRAAKQIAELNMYTAEDNPFHDANLTQQFQWHKKREKEKKSGITEDEAKRREQARRLEAKVCLCYDSGWLLSHVCLYDTGRTRAIKQATS